MSIGLSHNKFLAKIASDLDKPRGFAVLGAAEAPTFLAPKPVGFIYGVGAISAAKLSADGFRTIADLQRADETDLMRRYGAEGRRLARLCRGIDDRKVDPVRDTKSVSAETTFNTDISAFRPLEQHLWDLTERVLPDWTPRDRLRPREVVRRQTLKALQALGVGTLRHIRQHGKIHWK